MLDRIPGKEELIRLTGEQLYDVWQKLCSTIDEKYDMERTWNAGGKKWTYEYKYRRGGKTLCALYNKENCVGLMIIFGREERQKYELIKNELSENTRQTYDAAVTYHDGKWVMFQPTDTSLFGDYLRLLALKRKGNRNQ